MSTIRSIRSEEGSGCDDIIATATASNSSVDSPPHGSVTNQELEDQIKQFGVEGRDWEDTFEGILDLDDRPEGMLENGSIDSDWPSYIDTSSRASSRNTNSRASSPTAVPLADVGVKNVWAECAPASPRQRMDDAQIAVGGAQERDVVPLPSSQQAMGASHSLYTLYTRDTRGCCGGDGGQLALEVSD